MVADKVHARAIGQVQMHTRQPSEGRARGGGLRFGEMERDCLIGHGASALLRDRLLEESDKYIAYICETCGTLAYHDIKQNKYICRIDAEKAVISPVAISYAFKLLVQELMALGIAPRLNLEERASPWHSQQWKKLKRSSRAYDSLYYRHQNFASYPPCKFKPPTLTMRT